MQANADMLESPVFQPFEYVCKTPGKDLRSHFIQSVNFWLQASSRDTLVIQELVSKLHNASLIIDDIEDNSTLRRGSPATHVVFGVPQSINSANFMYFIVLRDILQSGDLDMLQIFTDEMIRLHLGQGQELYWRDNAICPTLSEYNDMILGKTGGLFRLATRLLQHKGIETPGVIDFVDKLSIYFQVRDDYLNAASEEFAISKSTFEDLTEGKFSFPVIRFFQVAEDVSEFRAIMHQHTTDDALKKKALQLLDDEGCLAYTRSYLAHLHQELVEQVDIIGENLLMKHLLHKINIEH